MSRAQKNANAEVLMSLRRDEMSKSEEKRKKGPKKQYHAEHKRSKDEPEGNRSQRDPEGRFQQYTPLTTFPDQVFMQIRDKNMLKWLEKN